jgi:hypothetical protein
MVKSRKVENGCQTTTLRNKQHPQNTHNSHSSVFTAPHNLITPPPSPGLPLEKVPRSEARFPALPQLPDNHNGEIQGRHPG